MIFRRITVFFLQNYSTKIHSLTSQMVFDVLKIIWSVSSGWFGALKYNIFPENASWVHRRIATM